ncbi:MAG TPA: glycosyltransferase family 39 protein, partial [Bryobacteraceae bacterium]
VATSGTVGLVLLARCAISPLLGFDTRFRWDYLAQKLLALHRFDFYPPLTPADFRTYFYVDGIPPMVSFTHWWMYASAGGRLPVLICLFVAVQFACTLAFTYGAASALHTKRAGILAAAALAACPLYFRSIVLGQETGLTALAVAAMMYFIVTAARSADIRAMAAAGIAAGLCALSREYGWIALPAGILALVWRRQSVKQVVVFAAVAAACGAPWYARNWIVAGNPFYSLRLAGFAVNPIHDAILQYYRSLLGVRHWTVGDWGTAVWLLIGFAPLQMLAGIPGALASFRRHGYWIAIALLLGLVWLQSVGYTSGPVDYSMRVLSPAMVVFSITAAGLLDSLANRWRSYGVIVAVIVLCQCLTAAHGVLYPMGPFDIPFSQWSQNAFADVQPPMEFQLADRLRASVPPGKRVLSDSAFLYAVFLEKGVEVVPVWSPEVRFLFTAPPEESERRLRDLHIQAVVYYPKSLNTRYLVSASPFYASVMQRWHVEGQVAGELILLVPKER